MEKNIFEALHIIEPPLRLSKEVEQNSYLLLTITSSNTDITGTKLSCKMSLYHVFKTEAYNPEIPEWMARDKRFPSNLWKNNMQRVGNVNQFSPLLTSNGKCHQLLSEHFRYMRTLIKVYCVSESLYVTVNNPRLLPSK